MYVNPSPDKVFDISGIHRRNPLGKNEKNYIRNLIKEKLSKHFRTGPGGHPGLPQITKTIKEDSDLGLLQKENKKEERNSIMTF